MADIPEIPSGKDIAEAAKRANTKVRTGGRYSKTPSQAKQIARESLNEAEKGGGAWGKVPSWMSEMNRALGVADFILPKETVDKAMETPDSPRLKVIRKKYPSTRSGA